MFPLKLGTSSLGSLILELPLGGKVEEGGGSEEEESKHFTFSVLSERILTSSFCFAISSSSPGRSRESRVVETS